MRERTQLVLASMTDDEWDELLELITDKVREALQQAIVKVAA